ARTRKIRGQWRANLMLVLRESNARTPMARIMSPTQLWLYSDQAMSAGVFGVTIAVPIAGSPLDVPTIPALSDKCLVAGEISFKSGVFNRGHVGRRRSKIALREARSFFRSTAGGWEVSDAAASKAVIPIIISASTHRFSRGTRLIAGNFLIAS